MSIRVQSEVWEHSKQKGGALLVLLALADNADNSTHHAWPSVADLARRSRMSRRQVQTVLRKLESDKEITVVQVGGIRGERRHATVYRVFHPDDRRDNCTGAKTARVNYGAQTGAVSDARPAKWSSPQPSENHQKKPSIKGNSKKDNDGWDRFAPPLR